MSETEKTQLGFAARFRLFRVRAPLTAENRLRRRTGIRFADRLHHDDAILTHEARRQAG